MNQLSATKHFYFGAPGASDEWYTPKYIFDAMACRFDLDVAAPPNGPLHVPTSRWLSSGSLETVWGGYVWMNSPFEGRNGLVPWLDKFFAHGNGVCLVPDRTSAPWWQAAARRANAVLFIAGKVKFIRPDGTEGKSPGDGTCLMASGRRGLEALDNARRAGLGWMSQTFMEDLD
jgi:hypothetical protein